jgi:hypothetical protein
MISCELFPTLTEMKQAQLAIADLNKFKYSNDDYFKDAQGNYRLTMVGAGIPYFRPIPNPLDFTVNWLPDPLINSTIDDSNSFTVIGLNGGIYIPNRWTVGTEITISIKLLTVPAEDISVLCSDGSFTQAQALITIPSGSSTASTSSTTFTAQYKGIFLRTSNCTIDVDFITTVEV